MSDKIEEIELTANAASDTVVVEKVNAPKVFTVNEATFGVMTVEEILNRLKELGCNLSTPMSIQLTPDGHLNITQ